GPRKRKTPRQHDDDHGPGQDEGEEHERRGKGDARAALRALYRCAHGAGRYPIGFIVMPGELVLEIVHVVPRLHEGTGWPATGGLLIPWPAGTSLRRLASRR